MPADQANARITRRRTRRALAAPTARPTGENRFPDDHPFTTGRLLRSQSTRAILGDTTNTLTVETVYEGGDDALRATTPPTTGTTTPTTPTTPATPTPEANDLAAPAPAPGQEADIQTTGNVVA